jgi:hypothetical protein
LARRAGRPGEIRIRGFNPGAQRATNITAADLGRSINDLNKTTENRIEGPCWSSSPSDRRRHPGSLVVAGSRRPRISAAAAGSGRR